MFRSLLSLAAVGAVVAGPAIVVGCNTFTGADGLEVSSELPATAPFAAADGVSLRKVEIYQNLLRPFMTDGELDDSDVPLVEGRDALLRLYVDLDEGLDEQEVTVRVTFQQAEDDDDERPEPVVFETEATVDDREANFQNLATTVNLTIPGDQFVGEAMRIELLMPTPLTTGLNAKAAFPPLTDDPAPIDLHASGVLKIVAIPVQYDADGSGRLPDVSEAQMARFREMMLAMYPATDVDIRVDAPYPSTTPIVNGGQGIGQLLDEISQLRDQRMAADDEYFYGFFAAADSFGEYCQGGCTTGLSALAPDPNAPSFRVSVGVGFTGDGSLETAAHEIGHAHGRQHAPCGGAGGPDPAYPHEMGAIGTWAYDTTAEEPRLLPPTTPDIMGYCQSPNWISDFNFVALLERLDGVAQLVAHRVPGPPQPWDRIRIDDDGARFLDAPIMLSRMPLGGVTRIRLRDADGTIHVVEGHYFEYDHLPGGILYLPASSSPRASFTLAGRDRSVAR